MAIRLKQLERIANSYTELGYIYKDLTLDIEQTSLLSPGFNQTLPGPDVKTSFDVKAIRNSLTNLFNTLPSCLTIPTLDLCPVKYCPIS